MKKLLLSLLIFFSMFIFSGCSSENTNYVYFNEQTLKYHELNCEWGIKCTVNCVKIPLKEAIARGGTPCKVCH